MIEIHDIDYQFWCFKFCHLIREYGNQLLTLIWKLIVNHIDDCSCVRMICFVYSQMSWLKFDVLNFWWISCISRLCTRCFSYFHFIFEFTTFTLCILFGNVYTIFFSCADAAVIEEQIIMIYFVGKIQKSHDLKRILTEHRVNIRVVETLWKFICFCKDY